MQVVLADVGPKHRRTRSSRFSDSIASITASITAQAIGPPPNVVPSRSSFRVAVTFSEANIAAQGKPLPSALAVVIMSGMTPYILAANG